jgi:hypothetical protein
LKPAQANKFKRFYLRKQTNKQTLQTGAGGMAQVPNKHKALSSNLSATKKGGNRNQLYFNFNKK